MTATESALLQTPLGTVEICATAQGLTAITFIDEVPVELGLAKQTLATAQQRPMAGQCQLVAINASTCRELLHDACQQLSDYFAGKRRTFTLPLAAHGTEFQQRVWRLLCQIPYGSTWSYGQQAAALGNINASRAVGAANGKNPLAIVVPCHRVIASNRALTGYAGGLSRKLALLQLEQSFDRNE